MSKYLLIVSFIFLTSKGLAQNSFGLELGTYYHNYQGINDFDSIRVVVNDNDRGEIFGGIFYQIQFKGRISILNKFLLRPIYVSNTVFNDESKCQFCPVKKGGLSPATNLSLEILPQFALIKRNELRIQLFGGINTSFNFRSEQPEVSFNGRYQGEAQVINALDKAVKPITFSLVYGASAEYKRLIFWFKYQQRSKYSKSLRVSGQNYNFKNTWQFVSFSMGYRFYSFKLGENKAR